MCCKAMTSSCLACSKGVSEKEFCKTNPGKYGCPKPKPEGPRMCCKAMTSSCLACSKGVSEKEFCKTNPGKYGCMPIKLLETTHRTHETQGWSARRRRRRQRRHKWYTPKPEGPRMCCKAMTSSCLACSKGVSEKEFCKTNPGKYGCMPTKLVEAQ